MQREEQMFGKLVLGARGDSEAPVDPDLSPCRVPPQHTLSPRSSLQTSLELILFQDQAL